MATIETKTDSALSLEAMISHFQAALAKTLRSLDKEAMSEEDSLVYRVTDFNISIPVFLKEVVNNTIYVEPIGISTQLMRDKPDIAENGITRINVSMRPIPQMERDRVVDSLNKEAELRKTAPKVK